MLYCEQNYDITDDNMYRILIVEDSDFMSKAIYRILDKSTYEIEQAFTFEKTQEKLSENVYDFIILDLNLPDVFGEELVSNVKRLTKAKIIVLATEVDVQIRESLFKNGILDYIVKDKNFTSSINSIDSIIQAISRNKESNILVLDELQLMSKHIQNMLNVRNYNTKVALNSQEGFEILNNENINLVILGVELTDKNGIDMLREIKDMQNLSHIPVIMLSNSDDSELVRNCFKNGASYFIKKPFNIEEFILKVEMSIDSNRKYIEVICKQKTLDECKRAVDNSTIVSRTDAKGIITYVNDKFCSISGYTREELMGKPHNIVRHPDMPSSVFKDLWETVQSKKPWNGTIKNLRKDGSVYYVQSTISPISNPEGEIVEYIGIRTDITELETLKEELNNELNISKKNFSEVYKTSQEYQKAINESSILSRTDINGKIVYVNDKFCQITGYKREELIGKTHSIVKDPSTSSKVYKNMWKTISSKQIWNGQLRNIKKDGSVYHIDSTIVPMLDENEDIIEYLRIDHDITEIVNAYKEVDDTQKEIIYKLGEVGESRSQEPSKHVKRVAEYSRELALLAGMGKKNAELLCTASPMHDIGKVGIPDSILKKPGKLDADEWEIMKTHAKIGYKILKDSTKPVLRAAALVSYRHHEKWDGSGYPNGLAGEKIHIFGRITAIADVFDALGNNRVYAKAWELEKILEYFKEERGKHFDPNLVDLFLDNLDRFLDIRNRFKDA